MFIAFTTHSSPRENTKNIVGLGPRQGTGDAVPHRYTVWPALWGHGDGTRAGAEVSGEGTFIWVWGGGMGGG